MTGTIVSTSFKFRTQLQKLIEHIEDAIESFRDNFVEQEEDQPLIIDVLSRYEMEQYNNRLDETCIVISINTPGRKPIPVHALTLHLDIVDTATDRGITARDALAIAIFVQKSVAKGKNHVVIHSDQGISRSAGIAAGLMRAYHMDTKRIINDGHFCINGRCYEYVCRAFHLSVTQKTIESDVTRNHQMHRLYMEKYG